MQRYTTFAVEHELHCRDAVRRGHGCRASEGTPEVQRGRTKEKPLKKTAPASPQEKEVSDVSRRAST